MTHNWKPAADGTINFSTDIDGHGKTHRERTATELLARLSVLRRSDPEAAIVATDLERLAVAQLARDDLEDTARTFWSGAFKTATGSADPLPEPPVAEQSTRYFAQPKHFDLLLGEDRAELKAKAAGVTSAQAAEALQLVELQEASEDGIDFGLSEAESAAALVLRDDQRYTAALDKLSAEVAEDRRTA